METQFRPYTLVAKLTDTSPSSIELKDTAGDPLLCNYVSVQSSSSNFNFFRVSYDPDGLTTPLANFSTMANMLGDTSGVVGAVGSTYTGGVVELLLSDKDRTSTIQLSHDVPGSREALYIITYGQIQHGNPLRDNERPIGN